MIDWDSHGLSISVAAAFFFDQEPYWIRYQEKRGRLNGIGSRTSGGERTYTLRDMRQMAHALLHYGAIDREGFKHCIERIDSMQRPVFKRRKQR